MTFSQSIKQCYSKYATFSGRARRSEFWYFNLFFLLTIVLPFVLALSVDSKAVVEGLLILSALSFFINILPLISVQVRRVHDLDMSGWWVLFAWIIGIVNIYLIFKYCEMGTVGVNKYGPPCSDGSSNEIPDNYNVPVSREEINSYSNAVDSTQERIEYKDYQSAQNDHPNNIAQNNSSGPKITLHVVGGSPVAIHLNDEIVMGRAAECDLPLPGDTMASKRHAALAIQRGILVLKDLGSSNGTFLNGSRINASEPIADGDCITVGRSEIRVAF